MSLQITYDDIDRVEWLLLRKGESFCQERRNFICSLDSLDVQACPGSGKTTALLAKLLILASKLPLPNNAGICILTHTNAAIDEIKKKFGKQASKIFQYPHYVGTIQTFVDKYLAIPAFIHRYGKRPLKIDNEQFNYEIECPQGVNLYNARFYLNKNHINLSDLRFSFKNFLISKSLNDETRFVGGVTPTYKAIEQHKLMVLEKGYLCFDDAYALAYQHLQKFPQICSLFSLRFKYVFIDEMQDTDFHQNYILDKVFGSGQTIVQRIGDQNQAIYTYNVREDLVWKPQNTIYINGSKRFSPFIANAIKNLGLNPQEMEGNINQPSIKPILILFDDIDIIRVIPYFCELINKELIQKGKLQGIANPVYKVVGWVGKEHESKHTILNYWPSYANVRKKKKSTKTCLDDFVGLTSCDETRAVFYKDSIVNGIIRFLKINNVTNLDNRYFTPSALFSYLQEKQPVLLNELNLNLTKWVLQISQGIDIFDQVKSFLHKIAHDDKFGFSVNSKNTQNFFEREVMAESDIRVESCLKLPNNISISVDTIHGVKGETHTSTLYLETFNNVYDVSCILDYFNPNAERKKLNVTQKRALKMAYVAMSRSTHLLCVAIHKNTPGHGKNKIITNNKDELEKRFGEYWQVKDISDATP